MKNTPPPESPDREEASPERIVRVATELFAEHGYDGVSTRQLAAATGLSVATVHHHIGSKRELYLEVYRGLLMTAESFVQNAMERVSEASVQDPEMPHDLSVELVNSFVDVVAEDPIRARLFMRHWLDGADEFRGTETELSLPLYRKVRDFLAAAEAAGIMRLDVDAGLFMRGFDWMVYGYFVAGAFDWKEWRSDPHDPDKLAEFKLFLRKYAFRMMGVQEGLDSSAARQPSCET